MDFRTWVAQNGDARYLGFLGNDGKIDPSKAGYVTSKASYENTAGNRAKLQGQANQWYSAYQNAQPGNNGGSYNPTYASGGGGGYGGSAAPQRDLAAESMYQSGIDQTNNLLGQVGTRRDTALGNLLNSYNTSKQRSQNAFNDNQSDYNTNVDRLGRENERKKTAIDTGVRNNMNSLQQLLASRGAGSSSDYQFKVPTVVAQKGTSERADAQQTYNDNLDATNTNWSRYRREWDQARADAEAEYNNKANATRSQFAEQEAGLRQKLQELNVNLANARGGDKNAINSANAQNAVIAQLQAQITQLANQVQGQTVNYNDPKYTAAQAKAYNDPTNAATAQAQNDPAYDQTQYYYGDVKNEQDKLLKSLYGTA
jgi:hypothetical protein